MNEKVSILRKFYQKKKRLPSYAEMMGIFGYKSKGGVTACVDKLIDLGVIGREDGKLFPRDLNPQTKILGTISAGFPSMGEEVFHQSISLDEWIITEPDATYMLQVEGDSMVDAGIHRGDYVIAEMTEKVVVGDIVVAEIDGQWTLKYLRENKKGRYLEAANEDYADMYPQEQLTTHAKVIGVVRRYD